jgi:hypothetical protein
MRRGADQSEEDQDPIQAESGAETEAEETQGAGEDAEEPEAEQDGQDVQDAGDPESDGSDDAGDTFPADTPPWAKQRIQEQSRKTRELSEQLNATARKLEAFETLKADPKVGKVLQAAAYEAAYGTPPPDAEAKDDYVPLEIDLESLESEGEKMLAGLVLKLDRQVHDERKARATEGMSAQQRAAQEQGQKYQAEFDAVVTARETSSGVKLTSEEKARWVKHSAAYIIAEATDGGKQITLTQAAKATFGIIAADAAARLKADGKAKGGIRDGRPPGVRGATSKAKGEKMGLRDAFEETFKESYPNGL